MKLKISKSQWEEMGKKAGWMKNAQVTAPVKAPTKTPVKAPTETPQKSPNKSPFQPPKPVVLPGPKAQKPKEEIAEDSYDIKDVFAKSLKELMKQAEIKPYETGAHPAVKDFWMNIPQEHPFAQHPILSDYGHNLSQEGYKYITQKTDLPNKPAPISPQQAMVEIQGLLQRIMSLEKTHEAELIDEAKNITTQIWGIDKNQLDAFLNKDEGEQGEEEQEEAPQDVLPLTPELRKEVNKRITINTLTQGSALHAMDTVHHLVADKINNISPELLGLYNRLSGLTTQHYYTIDINAIVEAFRGSLKQAALGWSHVEYGEGEDQPKAVADEGQAKVVASGIIFPVLCQELFKGVMELLSFHGINQNLSEQELRTVYHYADRLEDEPWIMTIGPELWRKFLVAVPIGISLSEIVMLLNQKSPDELNNIIRTVIQQPKKAKEILEKLKNENKPQVPQEPLEENYLEKEKEAFPEIDDTPTPCPSCGYPNMQRDYDSNKMYCPICNKTM